ncbi:16S rRNA (guanine(527)-N(7))-methyltransferase RsmG [Aliiglaciecola litoralis]|uniref:Ribosomal RNA small subunit methyltransferase G n=1 Tax=Aliiglaciecola litoralis TaxID=582857 RepID=A0ABP3X5U1_9ALTE
MDMLKTQLLTAFDKVTQPLALEITEDQRQKLVDFVLMINKWNKAYNLTSVRDPQDMLVKHIVDSIVVAPFLTKQRYIDVGTGPGLPGIPLSIMHPDKHFVLLDSLGKRVRFMKQAKFELGLDNIEPVQSRVEQYQPDVPLDIVLSRAFASIKDMLHWCQHLVDSQGEFFALKGQFPEQEIALLPDGFEMIESIELAIPMLEGDRHLIKIRKVS